MNSAAIIFVAAHCLQICWGSCPALQDPQSGRVDFSIAIQSDNTYPVLSVATYMCDNGFVLTGVDELRVCLHSGTWSGDAPTCSAAGDFDNDLRSYIYIYVRLSALHSRSAHCQH